MPKKEYDRMNPDERLIQKLDEYSNIDYGTEAYPLSRAEAAFIIFLIGSLQAKVVMKKHSKTLKKLGKK